jgi:hypothetical protein
MPATQRASTPSLSALASARNFSAESGAVSTRPSTPAHLAHARPQVLSPNAIARRANRAVRGKVRSACADGVSSRASVRK